MLKGVCLQEEKLFLQTFIGLEGSLKSRHIQDDGIVTLKANFRDGLCVQDGLDGKGIREKKAAFADARMAEAIKKAFNGLGHIKAF